jgi:hypothetical protein
MRQFGRLDPCDNLNHRRVNAPVRHYPVCGDVVNEGFYAKQCGESQHAAARWQQSVFCVDCGAQLIVER